MAMRVQISSSLGKTGIMVSRSRIVDFPDFSLPSTMICGGCGNEKKREREEKEGYAAAMT